MTGMTFKENRILILPTQILEAHGRVRCFLTFMLQSLENHVLKVTLSKKIKLCLGDEQEDKGDSREETI